MASSGASAIQVRLDGRQVSVAPGTSVAAALWNAGISGFRASVRGEPRGPVCGMGICFECRVTIDGVAHRRSCLVTCAPGMVVETAAAAAASSAAGEAADIAGTEAGAARIAADGAEDTGRWSQHGGASATRPEAAGCASWPPGAGRGAPTPAASTMRADASLPSSAGSTMRADVAVVGGGPAGLAAACRAAEAGASVLLLDEAAAPGGQVWRRAVAAVGAARAAEWEGAGDVETAAVFQAPDRPARSWLARLAASGARCLFGATVIDALPGPTLLVDHAGRALRVEARRLVIATGARERFLPFPGWTLPNAVGVGGVQALLKSGASLSGKRVVVAGSGPLLLPVAAALARAGAHLALVAEQAPAAAVARFGAGLWRRPRLLAQAARYRAACWRAPYRSGVWVSEASAAGSGLAVREATLTDGVRSWRERCDLLACAYGLLPNLELPRLLGCAVDKGGGRRGGQVRVDALQQTSLPGVYCAGEPTGVGGLELALLTGQIAGLAAAGAIGQAGAIGGPEATDALGATATIGAAGTADAARAGAGTGAIRPAAGGADQARDLRALQRRRDRGRRHVAALERAFQPRPELLRLAAPETVACRCEDVPLGRLDPSWTPRQAKLYTRAGMGACQGRVCRPALELLLGWTEADTVRAPLAPVALATLAELDAETGHAPE